MEGPGRQQGLLIGRNGGMALGSHYLDPDLQAVGILVDSTNVRRCRGSFPASILLASSYGPWASPLPVSSSVQSLVYAVSEVSEWVGPMDRSQCLSAIYSSSGRLCVETLFFGFLSP